MKRLLIVCLLLLSACSTSNPNDKQLSILSPFGAPSIALMQLMIQQEHTVNLVNGADLLVSALVKDQPEYDMIIAPINLGLSLISNNQTDYRCLAVVTWGNLYIVSDDVNFDVSVDTFVAFGKGAVPEKIINHVFGQSATVEYFPSVLDAQAQLLQNKTKAAVLAEPIVSATLLQNDQLKIVADLQGYYYEKTGYTNYPQAALFVHKDSFEESSNIYYEVIDQMIQYVESIHNQTNILKDDINQITHEQLGLPKTEVVVEALETMNIDVRYAKDAINEISVFMDLFDIKVTKEMYLE